MNIYTLNQRGEQHKHHCEDALFTFQSKTIFVGGIFDGCSTGIKSYFASSLFSRVFENNCSKTAFSDFSGSTIKNFCCSSLIQIKDISQKLQLSANEMLTTMLLLIVNIEEKKAFVLSAGDGYYFDGEIGHSIDHGNKPDYPAYYFNTFTEINGVETWWDDHVTKAEILDCSDISIASDGIESFVLSKTNKDSNNQDIKPIDFLLSDVWLEKSSAMLSRKCNILKNKNGLVPLDDLSVIRLRL